MPLGKRYSLFGLTARGLTPRNGEMDVRDNLGRVTIVSSAVQGGGEMVLANHEHITLA